MSKFFEIKRNLTYSESKRSFFQKFYINLTIKARYDFFEMFKKNTNYSNNKSLIDIGTTPSLDKEQNILLRETNRNKNLSILSNLNCKNIKRKYKNIKRVYLRDARKTYLRNNSFEIVHSNATLEHVGSIKSQISFVRECVRISKKFVFIQTPNRFYPMDFHTLIPFIHWLPKNIHRKILKILNLNFYSLEKNLNLLSESDLKKICEKLNINDFKIIRYKLYFLTSNLILIIKKNANI